MTSNETTDQVKVECSKAVRAVWATGEPKDPDYAVVVSGMHATKLVGRASVFARLDHVPITHMGYLKPENNAFLVELKTKDRRSAKKWEYVNGAGMWVDIGLSAL